MGWASAAPELELFRGWLSTGILGAILIVIGRGIKPLIDFLIETRKLKLQERKDDRQGYGDLIDNLSDQVERLATQVRTLSTENGQLRTEVGELHGILDGMRRANLAGNISIQQRFISLLPPEKLTDEVRQALKILAELEPLTLVREAPTQQGRGPRGRRR